MNYEARIKLIKTLATTSTMEAVARCCWHNIEQGYEENLLAGFHLGNAESMARDAGIGKHQFVGALGALEQAGRYAPSRDSEYVGHFGYMIR